MTGRRVSPSQRVEMLSLRDQGLTQAQIAARVGVSECTVQRHTRGLHKATNLVTQAELDEMQALRDKGLTQGQIADHLGRHKRTVERYTRRGYQRAVTDRDLAEMLSLAAEGLGRADIAAITGWTIRTVGKHLGHIVPRRDQNQKPDLARYQRMLKAVAGAGYGERADIARRFGLKDTQVLSVTLVRARRRVAEAQQKQRGNAA